MVLNYEQAMQAFETELTTHQEKQESKFTHSQFPYFILGIVLIVLAVLTLQGSVSVQLLLGAMLASFLKCF